MHKQIDTPFDSMAEIDEDEGPSRSQLKREAEQLQSMGERLLSISESELKKIPLPETLADAVALGRKITDFGGLKRQRQLIGKLMRQLEDITPITVALARLDAGHADNVREQHLLERWTAGLLAQDDHIHTEIRTQLPDCDFQRLRQLARQALREQSHNKPPKSRRELFKCLRDAYHQQQ